MGYEAEQGQVYSKTPAMSFGHLAEGSSLTSLGVVDANPEKVFFSPAPPRGLPQWLYYVVFGSVIALIFHKDSRRSQPEDAEFLLR
jgi:hypothetical protein